MFANTSVTVDIIKQLLAIGLAVFWQFLTEFGRIRRFGWWTFSAWSPLLLFKNHVTLNHNPITLHE